MEARVERFNSLGFIIIPEVFSSLEFKEMIASLSLGNVPNPKRFPSGAEMTIDRRGIVPAAARTRVAAQTRPSGSA